MQNYKRIVSSVFLLALLVFLLAIKGSDTQKPLRIAVASNFRDVMKRIVLLYEEKSGQKVDVVFASTGKHYAQIIHGAPFDILFAADSKRTALLEEQGFVMQGSRRVYALGQLALWKPGNEQSLKLAKILRMSDFKSIAFANPKLAPYGSAAFEVLGKLSKEELGNRFIIGENVAQAYQFVASGAVELGFVAYSQLKNRAEKESYWLVPQKLYKPIKQEMVQLRSHTQSDDFLNFFASEEIREIIRNSGYDLP